MSPSHAEALEPFRRYLEVLARVHLDARLRSAAVRDGDKIAFDLPKRTLSVDLADAEIQKRMSGWEPPKPRYTHGVFAKYAALVSSSSLGAITTVPASFASDKAPITAGRTL